MRKAGLEERASQIYRRVPDVRPALAHIFADSVCICRFWFSLGGDEWCGGEGSARRTDAARA